MAIHDSGTCFPLRSVRLPERRGQKKGRNDVRPEIFGGKSEYETTSETVYLISGIPDVDAPLLPR